MSSAVASRHHVLVALVSLLAFVLPSALYDLQLPDEPRVAHTSLETARSAGVVVPTVNGEPFLQTPPLYYVTLGLWQRTFGVEPDGLSRGVSNVCAILTLVVTMTLAWRFFGRLGAFLCGTVLASTFQFWDLSHRVVVDMMLTLFNTIGFVLVVEILSTHRPRLVHGLLLGFALALSFLTKGVPGPSFLAATTVAVFMVYRRALTPARLRVFGVAVIAAVAVVAPWVWALYQVDPSYPRELLLAHVLDRAMRGTSHNPHNFDFAHRALLHILPWTPFLLAALGSRLRSVRWRRLGRRRWSELDQHQRCATLALLYVLVPAALLALSRAKRDLYLLPCVPAVALVVAAWLTTVSDTRWFARLGRVCGFLCAMLVPVGAALILATPNGGGSKLVFAALGTHFFLLIRYEQRRRRGQLATNQVSPAFRAHDATPTDSLASRPGLTTTCLCLVLTVAMWGTLYRIGRSVKSSAAPLGRVVAALDAGGAEILGYQLSEREIAAVAWYLRHPFRAFSSEAELREEVGAKSRTRRGLVIEEGELERLRQSKRGLILSAWIENLAVNLRRRRLLVLVHEPEVPENVGGDQ